MTAITVTSGACAASTENKIGHTIAGTTAREHCAAARMHLERFGIEVGMIAPGKRTRRSVVAEVTVAVIPAVGETRAGVAPRMLENDGTLEFVAVIRLGGGCTHGGP